MKKIEVFHDDCPRCKETIELLKKASLPNGSTLTFWRLADNPDYCTEKAREYGFSLPLCPCIVVDGKPTISEKVPTKEEIKSVLGLEI